MAEPAHYIPPMAGSTQGLWFKMHENLPAHLLRHHRGGSRPDTASDRDSIILLADDVPGARKRLDELRQAQPPGRWAAGCVDMLIAGPPRYDSDEAWSLQRETAWANASLEWVKVLIPEAPIAIAALHRDQHAPLVHIAFVPVTRDGVLSWRRCMDEAVGRSSVFDRLHDSYQAVVGLRFGIGRARPQKITSSGWPTPKSTPGADADANFH